MALANTDLPKLVELLNLIDIRVKVRRKLAADWVSTNEVLLSGEWGKETDTDKMKQGNGTLAWNDLDYFAGGIVEVVAADATIDVDNTDPARPEIRSTVGALSLDGRAASYGALPTMGLTAGDAYLVEADGLIYIWDGSTWPADGAGLAIGHQLLAAAHSGGYITFDGLDLDSDFCYVIRGSYRTGAAASYGARIFLNGDYTAGNYRRVRHNNGAAFSDSFFMDSAAIATNSTVNFEIQILKFPGGYPVIKSSVTVSNAATGFSYVWEGADVLKTSTANVTKIETYMSGALSSGQAILERVSKRVGIASGGYKVSQDLVPLLSRAYINFDGDDFAVADAPGDDATAVALSPGRLASLALAESALQELNDDPTPALGGDLDSLRNAINNALSLTISGRATDYGSGGVGVLPAFISVAENHTWNTLNLPAIPPFFPASMFLPPVVEFTGEHSLKTSLSIFGGGTLFYAWPTIQNDPAVAGINITGIYALLDQATYRANGQDVTAGGFFVTTGSLPVFDAVAPNSFVGTSATVAALFSRPIVNTGASIGSRSAVYCGEFDGAGAVAAQAGLIVEGLTKATNNAALILGQTAHPPGNYCVFQGDEARSRWNGAAEFKQRIITGNRTLDLTDFYVLANSASALTATLPSAVGCAGRMYILKNVNTGVVTVATTSSQTIDGEATYLLKFARQYVTVQSDGANWVVVGASTLQLGPELLRNPQLVGGTVQWTAGAGWSAAGSVATAASVTTALAQTTPSYKIVTGKTYRVSYEMITATTGDLRFQFTGGTNDDGAVRSAAGVYSEDITITQTITSVRFINGGTPFSGTLCNISVREVMV